MTTLDDLERGLADLLTEDLRVIGERFVWVAGLPESVSAAAWGEWWAWRIVAVLNDRRGEPNVQEPARQDALTVAEMLAIADLFTQAATDADDDHPLAAAWCRALVTWLDLSRLDPGDDDTSRLCQWIMEKRAERPWGSTPGDTSGLGTWSQSGRAGQAGHDDDS